MTKKLSFPQVVLFVLVLGIACLLQCEVIAGDSFGGYCEMPDTTTTSAVEEVNRGVSREIQLALARICVSESGFQTRTFDCRLIYETLRYRSQTGEITLGIMRAYSSLTFNRNRTDRRRWIPFLNDRFAEPRHWSELAGIPWSTRRAAFQEVYNYVGYLLRYPQSYPCTIQVHHWGARGFRRRRHLREGWVLVDCGMETLNDFWSVPSRSHPETRVCNPARRICE
jgi:hypothetical protein